MFLQAKPLIKENKIKQLVDPVMGDDYDIEELERLVFIASLCIHQTSMNRPHMNQACILKHSTPSFIKSPIFLLMKCVYYMFRLWRFLEATRAV